LSGQWHYSSSNGLARISTAMTVAWHEAAQPERARYLRRAVALLLIIWAIAALTQLVWLFLPQAKTAPVANNVILNPLQGRSADTVAVPIDIEAMLSWNLLGVAAEGDPAVLVVEAVVASDRDGIEDGARETRLDLKLRGVIASTEDGLGHAIVEHRSKQEVYMVGDTMPTGAKVLLAKVMPQGVVLDNNGTYELLRLFEGSDLPGQVVSQAAPVRPEPTGQATPSSRSAGVLAQSFRDKLYENPQSLAAVLTVTAVRENNALQGYRVSPGKNSEQFSQLGFKAGDVITGVNGISLDNPANTMRLYQVMRTADEAVFDLLRDGESHSFSVSLNEAADGG
jgi:general secretion pathway protein C